MQFAEAIREVVNGSFVQRPEWGDQCLRLYRPDNLPEGACTVPKLRVMRNSDPNDHYTPQFTAEEIQADNWRLVEQVN